MKTISLCLFYHIQHPLGKDEFEMSKYILSKLQVSQQLSWGKDLLYSAGPSTSAPDHQEGEGRRSQPQWKIRFQCEPHDSTLWLPSQLCHLSLASRQFRSPRKDTVV